MPIPIMAILGGAAMGLGTANAFPPFGRMMQHTMNKAIPNEILDVDTALLLNIREKIDKGMFNNELRSRGFDDTKINQFIELTHQLLGIQELITLWRREKIADGALTLRAKHIGWNEGDVQNWQDIFEFRPNVQDVIHFAVREVYSPEISTAFGQFEGADAVASAADKDLKAAGVTKDTLAKYWAAHWDLPSVQMGYEMLHRGVIDEATLDMLLKALDVMPYWRDKLKLISYNPLTRVDVRRMHKLGILSDADLVKAYKDLGYDATNAQRLADFTIKYNQDTEASEKTNKDITIDKEKDLTKADIITGYRDGMFSVTEVSDSLASLGYSQDEVDYYITRADFERDKDLTNEQLKYYQDAYVSGVKSYNDTVDALGKLGLEGNRIAALFAVWDLKRAARVQKPTKAEILTFLRKKIIDQQTAIDELKGQGYADRYIQWYMATA